MQLLAPATPHQDVIKRIRADLLALPGAVGLSWSSREPDAVTLRFATEGFRTLADNVLRDAVDGVRLVLEAVDPTSSPADDAWTGSIHTQLAAIRAMPGVLSSHTLYEHGQWSGWAKCVDVATAERIRSIVNPTIGAFQMIIHPYGVPPKPQP